MFIGVFVYSFSIGSLSSLLSRIDLKNAHFNELINILIQIRKEFKINKNLFMKIKIILNMEKSKKYFKKFYIDFL